MGRIPHTNRPGFNEAEAIKPRKLNSARASAVGLNGFNEAEAIKPRKLATEVHADVSRSGLLLQ